MGADQTLEREGGEKVEPGRGMPRPRPGATERLVAESRPLN